MQETIVKKAISQYNNIKHEPTRWKDNIFNISELSFTTNKIGIDLGGMAITFCLQRKRTPLSCIDLTLQADSLLGIEEPSNYNRLELEHHFCNEVATNLPGKSQRGLTEKCPNTVSCRLANQVQRRFVYYLIRSEQGVQSNM